MLSFAGSLPFVTNRLKQHSFHHRNQKQGILEQSDPHREKKGKMLPTIGADG